MMAQKEAQEKLSLSISNQIGSDHLPSAHPPTFEFVSFVLSQNPVLLKELRLIILRFYKHSFRGIFSDCTHLFQFPFPGSDPESALWRPRGVRIKDGLIYVAQESQHPKPGGITIFDLEGKYTRSTGKIEGPMGVFIDDQNRIIVVETRIGQIKIINQEGVVLKEFGKGILSAPWGVVMDRKNRFIVTGFSPFLSFFDENGIFIKSIEGSASRGFFFSNFSLFFFSFFFVFLFLTSSVLSYSPFQPFFLISFSSLPPCLLSCLPQLIPIRYCNQLTKRNFGYWGKWKTLYP